MNMKDLQKDIHRLAKEKGWWDKERNDGEAIALMHAELSEALEAMRVNNWDGKDGVGEELADCVIRILDYCGGKDIDLEKEILAKHIYNKTREYKHGKEF